MGNEVTLVFHKSQPMTGEIRSLTNEKAGQSILTVIPDESSLHNKVIGARHNDLNYSRKSVTSNLDALGMFEFILSNTSRARVL